MAWYQTIQTSNWNNNNLQGFYTEQRGILEILGLYSLSGKTSHRKISWGLKAARFGFKLFQSLWNSAGTSAALPPRCLSNFRAIRPLQHPISRLRDFTRFGGKTSYRLVNRGPEVSPTINTQQSCLLKLWIKMYDVMSKTAAGEKTYHCKIFNIRCTKSQNLNDSHVVLH